MLVVSGVEDTMGCLDVLLRVWRLEGVGLEGDGVVLAWGARSLFDERPSYLRCAPTPTTNPASPWPPHGARSIYMNPQSRATIEFHSSHHSTLLQFLPARSWRWRGVSTKSARERKTAAHLGRAMCRCYVCPLSLSGSVTLDIRLSHQSCPRSAASKEGC